MSFHENMGAFLLGMDLRVELLGCRVYKCSAFRDTANSIIAYLRKKSPTLVLHVPSCNDGVLYHTRPKSVVLPKF